MRVDCESKVRQIRQHLAAASVAFGRASKRPVLVVKVARRTESVTTEAVARG